MIKGLYSAASALITGVYQQQAVTHDISNVETPGFKQILTSLTDFDTTSAYTQSADNMSSIQYLGELGLGVMTAGETTDFSQGSLISSDSPLDFAIEGDGFFMIQTENGVRYTRDGRFSLDTAGNLVTVDGNYVLSPAGQPIKLSDGDIAVSTDGSISVNNISSGKIGLAYFKDLTTLTRDGDNSFSSSVTPATTGGGSIIQSSLEQSNVDTAELMVKMIEILRSYQAAQQMVQNQDELLGKTISTLGKVS